MDVSESKCQRFLEKVNNLAKNFRQDRLVVAVYLHICHEIRDRGSVQTDRMR